MTIKTNSFGKEVELKLFRSTYSNTGAIYIGAESLEREPWKDYTANVDGVLPGEVPVKNYSEGSGNLSELLNAGLITKPHREIPSGFVSIPICYLTPKGEREIEKRGF